MEDTTARGNRDGIDTLVALTAADIEALPWHPVTDCPGVRVRELWRAGDFVHAMVVLEPGARTPGLPHLAACHHIWVVSGAAAIGGRHVAAGSYVYVPPGVAHPFVGLGPEGCTLLQVHRPHDALHGQEPHRAQDPNGGGRRS